MAWLWHVLGLENVTSLSQRATDILGLGCKPVPGENLGVPILVDPTGQGFEPSSHHVRADLIRSQPQRFEEHRGNKLSVPNCLEINDTPPPSLDPSPNAEYMKDVDSDDEGSNRKASLGSSMTAESFRPPSLSSCGSYAYPDDEGNVLQLRAALQQLADQGGSFMWYVPMVQVSFREKATANNCEARGLAHTPLYVSAITLGAKIRLAVVPNIPGRDTLRPDSQASSDVSGRHSDIGGTRTRLPSMFPKPLSSAATGDPSGGVEVPCKGFKLLVWQYGGPLMDTGKLYKKTPKGVAQALDRWYQRLVSKVPDQWTPLWIETQPCHDIGILPRLGSMPDRSGSNTQSVPTLKDWAEPMDREKLQDLSEDKTGNRMSCRQKLGRLDEELHGAVPLALTARITLVIDPIKLSYGDDHLQKMGLALASEIVSLLTIPAECVICAAWRIPKQDRTVTKPRVVMDLAFLHPSFGQSRAESQLHHDDPFKSSSFKVKDDKDKKKKTLTLSGAFKNVVQEEQGFSKEPRRSKSTPSLLISGPLGFNKEEEKSLLDVTREKKKETEITAGIQGVEGTSKGIKGVQVRNKNWQKAIHGIRNQQNPINVLRRFLALIEDPTQKWRRHADLYPMMKRVVATGIKPETVLVVDRQALHDVCTDARQGIGLYREKPSDGRIEREQLLQLEQTVDSIQQSSITKADELEKREGDAEKEPLPDVMARLRVTKERPVLHQCLRIIAERTVNNKAACKEVYNNGGIIHLVNNVRMFTEDHYIQFQGLKAIGNMAEIDPDSCDAFCDNMAACLVIDSLTHLPDDAKVQEMGVRALGNLQSNPAQFKRNHKTVMRIMQGSQKPDPYADSAKGAGASGSAFDNTGTKDIMAGGGASKILIIAVLNSMRAFLHNGDVQRAGLEALGKICQSKNELEIARTNHAGDLILAAMQNHERDRLLQEKACAMLSALKGLLYKGKFTEQAVTAVVGAMQRFPESSSCQLRCMDVLRRFSRTLGIAEQIVDSAGVPAVRNAMARHRSNLMMQREGAKTLLAFTISDQYLNNLRNNGTIATVVQCLISHNRDSATVHESTKTLERLCPRAMGGFRACCKDAQMALPDIIWSEKLTADDRTNFQILEGYRRFTFRSELDFHTDVSASAAPPSKRLDTPGPSTEEINGLCALLRTGLDKPWSELNGKNLQILNPVDVEFYCCLISHYAWYSEDLASQLLTVDGPGTLLNWLVHPSLGSGSLLNQAAGYPARCACLMALASFASHGGKCVERIMDLDITDPLIECLHHVNADIRRSSMRLLAPLITYGSEGLIDQPRFFHGLGRGLQDLEPGNRIAATSLLLEVLAKKPIHGNPEWVPDGLPLHMCLLSSLVIAQKIGGVAMLPGILSMGRLANSEPSARMLVLDTYEGQALIPMLVKAVKAPSQEGLEATSAAAAWALGQICQHSRDLATMLSAEQGLETLIESTVQATTQDLKSVATEAIELVVSQISDCLLLSRMLTHKGKVKSHGFMGLDDTSENKGHGYTFAGPEVLTIFCKQILKLIQEDINKHGSEEAFSNCKLIPLPAKDESSEAITALREVMLEIRKLSVHFFVGSSFASTTATGGKDKASGKKGLAPATSMTSSTNVKTLYNE